MASTVHDDLRAAASTWNVADEDLASVNARIHGGTALDALDWRADTLAGMIFDQFPYVLPAQIGEILEIGPGTGYIMQGVDRRMRSAGRNYTITGVDIAEHMLARARSRLGDRPPFKFVHYDGLRLPFQDRCMDMVYSIQCLQHVPKPYVYSLFFEINRVLRPGAFAVMQFLSFKHLREQEKVFPWREEIRAQIEKRDGHWHYFYSAEELLCVLRDGNGFGHVDMRDGEEIWVCIGQSTP
jgi:SAM-dependent methyltransferase